MEQNATKKPVRLLVVDDDPGLRRQLRWAFDDYKTTECGDRKAALEAIRKAPPAVVLLDLGLPPDPDGPSEGLAALRDILTATPEAKVIVLTGQKERAYALKAVSLGAYDFYQKPVDVDELTLIVARAANLHELERENRDLQAAQSECKVPGLITQNARMQQVGEQIARFAEANVAVLIVGESGTGKELLAHGLHTLGHRAEKGQYIALNCAAIPENLLESELFGYERGAFTGAHKTTIGKFEQANGGTLLLDEIGDLPASLQAKLLRVLQERKIERVGGRRGIPVDFRIVSATNRDLEKMVAEGGFREDLFYRLSEAVVRIPPLRERPEDAVLIAQSFLKAWTAEQGLHNPGLSPDALAVIGEHAWPGNVRELQSRLKRAAVNATGRITARDLELAAPSDDEPARTLKEARQSAEYDAIRKALSLSEGNISEAARLLGVSRQGLYQLLSDHKMR